MKDAVKGMAIAAVAVGVLVVIPAGAAAQSGRPGITYAKDVAPILY